MPSPLPPVPHYAVIFTSKRRSRPGDGYPEMAEKMEALVSAQPGLLGVDWASTVVKETEGAESVTGELVSEITISYWTDESCIKAWKRNLDHLVAQKKGKEEWFLSYEVRVSKVERAYTGGTDIESISSS